MSDRFIDRYVLTPQPSRQLPILCHHHHHVNHLFPSAIKILACILLGVWLCSVATLFSTWCCSEGYPDARRATPVATATVSTALRYAANTDVYTIMSPNDIAALLETRAKDSGLEQALIENAERLAVSASTDDGIDALRDCISRTLQSDEVHKVPKDALDADQKRESKLKPPKHYHRVSDKPVPGVEERDGEPVTVYKNEQFENWTSANPSKKIIPLYTFAPKTRQGVVSVVKYAREKRLRIRVAGSRMSTPMLFGNSGEVLISLAPLGLDGKLHDAPTDLERIQMVRVENRGHSGLVRIGAAATAEHFRKWATAPDGGDWRWMLDALPSIPAATSAGWTQVASAGSGVAHPAVCDQVTAIEFVNCRGDIQTVTDAKQLRAISAGLGVFGVVLSQTFRVNKLQVATMRPLKRAVPLAIPPPSRAFAPHADEFDTTRYSDKQLEDARKRFVDDAAAFHCAWTWYPFHRDVYVNVWDTRAYSADTRPASAPSAKEARWARAHAGIAELFSRTPLRLLPRVEQTALYAKTVMAALPGDKRIDASVPDAMLFRRGTERVPTRNASLCIPIPLDDNGKLDLYIVQKAWWIAINEVYAAKRDGRAPCRIAVEMRITGGSHAVLAPMRDNAATCVLDLVTIAQPDEKDDTEWRAFVQKVTDRLCTIRNPVSNQLLAIRPHWASEWPPKMRGERTKKYLRDASNETAPFMLDMLRAVAKDGGYELDDMLSAFGNDSILGILAYQKKKGWLGSRR